MRIIPLSRLREYARAHPDVAGHLRSWEEEMHNASFPNPHAVKQYRGHVSIIRERRLVFNISGNRYRLIAQIDYERQILTPIFFGTHTEYDRFNSMEVHS